MNVLNFNKFYTNISVEKNNFVINACFCWVEAKKETESRFRNKVKQIMWIPTIML